ncbi:MAG: hypothetical protein NXI10_13170 [bacterium]|nr:hypothetical protein [bacterium]
MAFTSSFSSLFLFVSFLTFGQEELALNSSNFLESPSMDRPAQFVQLSPVNYSSLEAVKKNGKLELSVSLPGHVQERVDNFVYRVKGAEKLNPFDPQDIDITVLFMHANKEGETDTLRAFGFYYQEFRRNNDMKSWGNVRSVVHPNFRVRFTPQQTGEWQCEARVRVKGNEEVFVSPALSFTVVRSDLPGFIVVSENNHYLEVDGELFLPQGMNMPTQGGNGTGYRSDGARPAEYVAYMDRIQELRDAGGNYFRFMTTPWTTEVEFETLGDYTERLPQAWEMDQLVEKCEDIGIRIHWNMSYMTQLSYIGVFGLYFWDWTDARDSMCQCDLLPNWFEKDVGFCYHTDPTYGVETVDEFLTDKDLIRYYQNRLRYMVARWGYSTHIGVFELYNEINFSGVLFDLTDDCQLDQASQYKPYFNDTSYVRKVSDWQIEMGRFLKEDLHFYHHPYAVNYGGAPIYVTPDEYPYDPEDGAALACGDEAYFSEYVDVMTYNDYFSWPKKYEYQHGDLIKLKKFAKKQNVEEENYEKPLIYSEVGTGQHGCDNLFTFRQMYVMSPFTGAAGAGMPWHYNNNMAVYDSVRRRELGWSIMPVMDNFFSDVPLNRGNWIAGFDIRKDERAELLYLTEGKRAERAVAVISNRTVNRYTMRESWCDENPDACDCDLSESDLNFFPDVYEEATAFDWNDKRGIGGAQLLKVSGMEFTSKYRIVFYDAFTGDFVMEITKWSDALGNLKLKYPELAAKPEKEGGAANGSMLLVKIFKAENASFSTITE